MKLAAIFSFSRQGSQTALRAAAALREEYHCQIYTTKQKPENEDLKILPDRIGAFTGSIFEQSDLLVYVGACGIAVRAIAPYIKSKTKDPAVICIDERAQFCISLLSGHIGGANRLTKQIAQKIGAEAIITTATDINHRFSVDEWANRKGFTIGNMNAAKEVSAAILEQEIPICADRPLSEHLPSGLYPGAEGNLGILVSIYRRKPFLNTLNLIPKTLTLGIGCRKGTTAQVIEKAVFRVLKEHNLDFRAVYEVASINLKSAEAGLLEFCRKYGLPIHFYDAKQLLTAQGNFTCSEFVKGITGVDNVCERSAVMGEKQLILKKTAYNGVTVAAAERDWEVSFEE